MAFPKRILGCVTIFAAIQGTSLCLKLMAPPTVSKPVISVTHWMEAGEMRWGAPSSDSFGNSDTDLIMVDRKAHTMSISNNIATIVLTCKANYPIEWVTDVGNQIMASNKHYFMRGKSTRDMQSLFVESTYTFSNDLIFGANFKEYTGNYTCQQIGKELQSAYVYIFWEGVVTTSLLRSGESISVSIQASAKELVIPCRLCVQDTNVTLLKSTTDMYYVETFHRLLPSKYVAYDPRVGFTINLEGNMNPVGTYKCVTDQPEDFLQVTVNRTLDGPQEHCRVDVLQRGAKFEYVKSNQTLVCCSSGNKPPEFTILECLDPIGCKMFEKAFLNGMTKAYAGQRYYHSESNNTCTSLQIHPFFWGHFKCQGDGVDVVRTIYTGIPSNANNFTQEAYTSFEEIDPKSLMQITVNENFVDIYQRARKSGRGFGRGGGRNKGKNRRRYRYRPQRRYWSDGITTLPDKVYVGESFNFTCRASASYFAQGSRFVVMFSNGLPNQIIETMDVYGQTKNKYEMYYMRSAMTEANVNVVMAQNMEVLICYAPVYNATHWIEKTIRLNVLDPTLPSFRSSAEDEIINWTLNETSKWILCEAVGDPLPNFTISFNGKEITNGTDDMHLEVKNDSIILRIKQVTHQTHGDYICTAYNIAGVTTKTFTVNVMEPTHWGLIVGVSATISILVTILVIVAVKLQLQNKLRARLTRNFYSQHT